MCGISPFIYKNIALSNGTSKHVQFITKLHLSIKALGMIHFGLGQGESSLIKNNFLSLVAEGDNRHFTTCILIASSYIVGELCKY